MTDPITTPAQMREAAALAVANIEIGYHDGIGGDWHPYNGLHIISAACAAIRALPVAEPEPLAVKVKPLQWHKSHMSGWDGDWHTVPTGYTIRCADENGWKWSTPLGAFGYEHSPEAAKSAAEADHAARILSQIEAVSVAQVRAEALDALLADDEMCLRLAEGYDREDAAQRGEPSPHTMGEDGYSEWAADRIACAKEGLRAAIRALMEKPTR